MRGQRVQAQTQTAGGTPALQNPLPLQISQSMRHPERRKQIPRLHPLQSILPLGERGVGEDSDAKAAALKRSATQPEAGANIRRS